jgi:hypothetical protein
MMNIWSFKFLRECHSIQKIYVFVTFLNNCAKISRKRKEWGDFRENGVKFSRTFWESFSFQRQAEATWHWLLWLVMPLYYIINITMKNLEIVSKFTILS